MSIQVIIGVEQEPRIQFTLNVDSLDEMPDIIKLQDGSILMLNGKYLSKGRHYSYRRADKQTTFNGTIKEWVKYSGLTG